MMEIIYCLLYRVGKKVFFCCLVNWLACLFVCLFFGYQWCFKFFLSWILQRSWHASPMLRLNKTFHFSLLEGEEQKSSLDLFSSLFTSWDNQNASRISATRWILPNENVHGILLSHFSWQPWGDRSCAETSHRLSSELLIRRVLCVKGEFSCQW